jgi:hypothetical protein
VVVTEGAQERSVAALGLDEWIDALVTTNIMRVGKTEGLFGSGRGGGGVRGRGM